MKCTLASAKRCISQLKTLLYMDAGKEVGSEVLSYLRSQLKLDLIHEYESIWVMGFWPAQKHPVVVALPGYGAGDVVSFFWRKGKVVMASTEVWRHNSLGFPENIYGFNIYQQPSVFQQN